MSSGNLARHGTTKTQAQEGEARRARSAPEAKDFEI